MSAPDRILWHSPTLDLIEKSGAEVEIIAPTTPIDTIQLHSMPRTNRVNIPAAPYSA